MSTELQIVNLALRLLGDDPLTAPEYAAGVLRRAISAKDNLPGARVNFIKDHRFNRYRTRASLALDPDPSKQAPVWGYTYQYAVPIGELRILELEGRAVFEREGDWILTNATAPCNVIYLADQPDYTKLPEDHASAIAAGLAVLMTEDQTGKETIHTRMQQVYQMRCRIAKGNDGLEGEAPTTWPENQGDSLVNNR